MMKTLIAVLAVTICATSSAMAAEGATASDRAHGKRDPNEVLCKVQTSTTGHPERICVTRAEWDKASLRTRQEMMLTQRGFCGGGAAC